MHRMCCCNNSVENIKIHVPMMFLHERNLPATRKRERKRDNKCAHHTARWNLLSIAENQSSIVAIEPPGLDCRNSMRSCVPLCMCAVCVCVCVHACDSDCHPDVSYSLQMLRQQTCTFPYFSVSLFAVKS